jgi:hypothetical protein
MQLLFDNKSIEYIQRANRVLWLSETDDFHFDMQTKYIYPESDATTKINPYFLDMQMYVVGRRKTNVFE